VVSSQHAETGVDWFSAAESADTKPRATRSKKLLLTGGRAVDG